MYRNILQDLLKWKDSPRRKPLVVRGARQVGKTWAVEHFAASSFESVVKLDFEKRPDFGTLFAGDLGAKGLVEQMEIVCGRKITPGRTLLFFDEIQACPRALMALRYFAEELPGLHVVASGSLLEFAMREIPVPVGRVSYLQMHPMTFAEYLRAVGNERGAEFVSAPPAAASKAVHEALLAEVRRYCFTGGLPECVAAAAGGALLADVFAIQDDLVAAYRDDFAKYAGRADRTCLDLVMRQAARSAGEQIIYTKLAEGFAGQTVRHAFDLLCMARIIRKIPVVSLAGVPLGASANERKFKAAFLDVGLMQRLCGVSVEAAVPERDLLALYRGKLAEQFVAQELLAAHGREVYYWARDARGSEAEVDYAVEVDGKVFPVEVKSGAGGSLKSLHLALREFPECPAGIVLYSGEYAERPEARLRFVPLYYAGNLRWGAER
jgi:predicted AAA+ superfamily ATPase